MDADPRDVLSPRSRGVPRAVIVRIGIGAAVALLVAAFATAVLVGMLAPSGDSGRVPAVTVTAGDSHHASSAPTPTAVLYVHVLGAVERPGLYTLATGARVVDAIGAAGGLTDDAEQSGVNLARELGDGEQLIVPRVGEVVPGGTGAGAVAGSTAPGATVNLNTASEEQLETLPRIGPAMAAKIIAWRTENGRFTSVDDLMSVSGIGTKTFDGLKGQVTV